MEFTSGGSNTPILDEITVNYTSIIPCQDHNVWGWAWSENIGWLSFSCANTMAIGTGNDYGVDINPATGLFSGYAWSENVGWISFNSSDLVGCPSGTCEAKVSTTTGQVSGWARALAYGGGWDGWIKLRDTNYGVWIDSSVSPAEFRDWAWSDMVIGWISFNCKNQNVCATSNYKVMTTPSLFNQPPTAAISCDPSECGTTDCIAYTGCPFHLINHSTDPDGLADIVRSEWDILNWGVDPDLSCTPPTALCNFTPQTAILTAGTYTTELYVQDSAGASDTETITFYLKQEAIADFMCSLDNLNWKVCETLKPFKGELVYFKDDPSLLEHSTPSEGATSITKRTWKLDGNIFNSDNNPNPSTNLNQTSNTIELEITDNLGRTDSISHTISTKLPPPEWREIAPF